MHDELMNDNFKAEIIFYIAFLVNTMGLKNNKSTLILLYVCVHLDFYVNTYDRENIHLE